MGEKRRPVNVVGTGCPRSLKIVGGRSSLSRSPYSLLFDAEEVQAIGTAAG